MHIQNCYTERNEILDYTATQRAYGRITKSLDKSYTLDVRIWTDCCINKLECKMFAEENGVSSKT